MAACEFCTGTHYLQDMPELGPCVCCTPENMQKRDRTIADLTAHPPPPAEEPERSAVEKLDLAESLLTSVRDAIARRDAWRGELAATLANYLESIGLPAVPVTIENPHLAELYEQIQAVADVEPEQ